MYSRVLPQYVGTCMNYLMKFLLRDVWKVQRLKLLCFFYYEVYSNLQKENIWYFVVIIIVIGLIVHV